jgi:hypothetical protein
MNKFVYPARRRYPQMEKHIVYRETVPAYAIAAIFLIIAFLMAFSLYHQRSSGPIGLKSAPDNINIAGAVFALLVGLNFSAIRIQLTDVDMRISYGLFSKRLFWHEVASCEIDRGSALRYGGWGIRLGSIGGKKVWVYNTFGGTRVAFLTRSSEPSGMVVTTCNPEELMRVSNQQIQIHKI